MIKSLQKKVYKFQLRYYLRMQVYVKYEKVSELYFVMGVSGEITTFLFLRTITDSGLSEVEVSCSFSFLKFSKITSRNTLGLMLKFSNLKLIF